MSDHKGPWEPRPELSPQMPQAPRGRSHLGLWIGLIVAAAAGVWALSRLFPGAVSTGDDWSNVAMTIDAAPMSSSLLGMSFLKQLDSFQVRNGRLDLKW